ncbi:restriction endonuclease subunit S [Marinobacter oulmenensis]|uniref:Type I restriction enzyme S subunit n=1 Tax=Marinobacter oulmenensis TaxID=643747 RepID=A0A840UK23_9GAMM|nr:restriction endonuclease subunit S [Marinobacter oulmenensis]MBB5321088.1 type I restriction enzyme S subunit [Marinobacter oulmenensis]
MTEFVDNTLGEVCQDSGGIIQTGPFGSQLHQSDYSETGIPVVMPADIKNGRIDETRVARVSEGHVERLKRHKLEVGDIVYGRRGDIGRQAIIRSENEGWLCGTGCLRLSLGENPRILPEYLHLYLSMPEVIGWIQNQAIGATMPNLNTQILKRVPLIFPEDFDAQKKIVAIVAAYDDLIENNKRRITLLENMAEEIYREWFVRFRFPGWQEAKFEKGQPVDWILNPVSEAIEINPTERIDKGEEKPFVGMDTLSTNAMYFETQEWRTGNSGSKFRNGDTLFPRITPCLENGKRGFVMSLEEGQVAVGSTEFIVMRGKLVSPEYTYLLCSFPPFRTHAEQSMVGASGRQRVAENCFSFFLIRVPPVEIMDNFTKLVRPIFNEIGFLNRQNSVLEQTRNQLLPRLISGKLSVENLDIQFPPSMQSERSNNTNEAVA